MKRALVDTIPDCGQKVEIPPVEADHLIKVLRLQNGDHVELLDGRGSARNAVLKTEGKKLFALGEQGFRTSDPSAPDILPVTLEVCVLKGDAMEWVIEKATELGVARIVPLWSDHGVVQTGSKSKSDFRIRWQKISDQALKQCGRLHKMSIEEPVNLSERLEIEPTPIFLDPLSSTSITDWNPDPKGVRIFIGPEGGWSLKERDFLDRFSKGYNLGSNTLRAETAALYVASICCNSLKKVLNLR